MSGTEAPILNSKSCALIEENCIEDAIVLLNKALIEISQSPPSPNKVSGMHVHGNKIHQWSKKYYPDDAYDEGMMTFSGPISLCEARYGSGHKLEIEATILFNLGIAHSRRGDENETRICMEKCLDIQQQRIGLHPDQDHLINGPSLCAIFHNIGHSYWRCGRYTDAISSYEKALDLLSKHQSKNQLDISSTLNCIAVATYYSGHKSSENNSDAILSIFTHALALRLSHPASRFDRETATIINNTGRVRFSNGEFSAALIVYRKAYSYRVTILGENHIDVAASLFNMAQAEEYQGHFPEAIELYKKFLPIAASQKGEGDKTVAEVLLLLGDLTCKIGHIDQAYGFFTRALKSSNLAFGQNSDPVATILTKIGGVLYQQGRFDLALETYQVGLSLQRMLSSTTTTSAANSNSRHNKIAASLLNMARIYRHKGDMDEALASYMETLAITRRLRHHEATASTLVEVALIHEARGNIEVSVMALEEAVCLCRLLLNQDLGDPSNRRDLLLASTLNNLGLAQSRMGRGSYNHALSSFLEVIEMHESMILTGANSGFRDIATVCFNAATIYKRIGEDEKALELYKDTLRLEQTKCDGNDTRDSSSFATSSTSSDPPNYKDMALLCCHIGEILKDREDFDEAFEYLDLCYEICTEHLTAITDDSPFEILKLSGDLFLQIGETGRAMESYTAAMRISHSPTIMDDDMGIAEVSTSHLFFHIDIFALVSNSNPSAAAAA